MIAEVSRENLITETSLRNILKEELKDFVTEDEFKRQLKTTFIAAVSEKRDSFENRLAAPGLKLA